MKVRAGKFRGANLKMDSDSGIRPVTGRIKSAIFDILPMDLSGAIVLDLFAGSGSLGIECLSRGANGVVFVDQGSHSKELLRSNLAKLGCLERSFIINKKASAAVNQLGSEQAQFHLVFIDPPFDRNLCGITLAHIAQSGILADGAIVVNRSSTREKVESCYGGLVMKDQRKYGDSLVSFYDYKPELTVKEEGN
jgi:16S rRNA (guanine966-N2)-methyltransferase